MPFDADVHSLGAHVSIAGGIFKAIDNGMRIGATAIQIFSKNQTRWVTKQPAEEDIEKFKVSWQQSSIRDIMIHDSYLINLGSPDKIILEKSRLAFLDESKRAQQLGINYLIFHPGSHINSGELTGLQTIAQSVNRIIDLTPDDHVRFLLETTAGQGSNLGYTYEQLAQIIEWIDNKERIGVCLDTAHIFASGYDIRTEAAYRHTVSQFDSTIGLHNLFAIHLNDSKKELGSRVDRHEHIGKGHLGLEPFRLIVNDQRLIRVPKVLEIPGTEQDFKNNLDLLKSLIE